MSKEIGTKFDEGKPRWELLPLKELEEAVEVLTKGAKLYGDYNWQHVEPEDRYLGAMFRHIKAWRGGERNSQDMNQHHLAHVICNCLFLMWFDNNRVQKEE